MYHETVIEILHKYEKLGNYCEKFWGSVAKKYPMDIACHAGCGICCELQSVNMLEAFYIFKELSGIKRKSVENQKTGCAFLENDTCSIYSIRPLICRTHGLIIKSVEFTSDYSITCPYNFGNCEEIPQDAILDIDTVTKNHDKLNLEFCLLLKRKDLVAKRISLPCIAQNNLSPEIHTMFTSML